MKINSKEQSLLNNSFYNWSRVLKANFIFNSFIKRINEGKVKNDGSDELLTIIDKYVIADKNNSFYKTIRKGKRLYRARIVHPESIKNVNGISFDGDGFVGFDESGSREAPLGISDSGRNNIAGVSYLYLADKPETACSEIKPKIRQLISLAEFQTTETFHIVDFASEKRFCEGDEDFSLGHLFTRIMSKYYEPVTEDTEYRATQFLTDYIRKTGIDGIAYRSFYDENGINYTIFNSNHLNIRFVKSRLLMFQSERKTFLDFNYKKVIKSESIGGASYDAESAQKMQNDIMKTINSKS